MNLLCNIFRDYTIQSSVQKYIKTTNYVLVIRTAELHCTENHINVLAIDNVLHNQATYIYNNIKDVPFAVISPIQLSRVPSASICFYLKSVHARKIQKKV